MPRTKKKDGEIVTAYIRRDLYERMQNEIPPNMSRSEFIEKAIESYLENIDIVKEFEELSRKYAELIEKCEGNKNGNFTKNLRGAIAEGKTWREVLESIGIRDPKTIVSYFNTYTYFPQGTKNVRLISGIDDWILVKTENTKSNIDFVFKKRIKVSQRK